MGALLRKKSRTGKAVVGRFKNTCSKSNDLNQKRLKGGGNSHKEGGRQKQWTAVQNAEVKSNGSKGPPVLGTGGT